MSIPLSFLLGVVGSYVGGRAQLDPARQAEMEVRALTGAGAEKGSLPVKEGPAIPPVPVPDRANATGVVMSAPIARVHTARQLRQAGPAFDPDPDALTRPLPRVR